MLVFTSLRQNITRLWQGIFSGRPAPLVNTRHDFRLMQRLHGRKAPSWLQLRFISKVLPRHERVWFVGALTVFSLSLLAIGFGFLAQFRVKVPVVGGEYIEGVVGSPHLINPIFASENEADLGLVRLVYSGLMRFDQSGHPVTDLAQSYTVGSDKRTYTFVLSDAKWHDGQTVTASDVVFTFGLIQDKTVDSPLATVFSGVAVTKIDDHTVQFVLPEVYPAFLNALTVGIVPEHIWGSIAKDKIAGDDANQKPVGSGPFMFKRLIAEDNGFISRVELERNPNYFHKPAFIKSLIFQYYPEYEGDGGALEALRAQKIQGLGFVPNTYTNTAATKHVQLKNIALPQYTALFFNLSSRSAVKDHDVRQALTLAINKAKILQDTLGENGAVIEGPVLPDYPSYTMPKAAAVDTDAANSLLDKKWNRISVEAYKNELIASFVREHTSASSTTSTVNVAELKSEAEKLISADLPEAQVFFRRSKDTQDLVLRLVVADTPEYRKVAGFVAGYWQDIGVRTIITYVHPRDLARDTLKNREYDVLLAGVILGNDTDQFAFWHSSQIQYPGLNIAGYSNSVVDGLLLKIRLSEDQAEQNKLYTEFEQQLVKDLPAIFLYSPEYVYGLGREIQGFGVTRLSHPADRLANITEWHLKTKSSFAF